MAEHLVFTLAAALGAMGEFAGHERRGSLAWPGRAAVLGLVGAAMGIRRDGDFSALDKVSIAVAVFDAGGALRDYHTTQTVPRTVIRTPQSRPEALALAQRKQALNTVLTQRDYRAGPLFGVALWGAGANLADTAAALRAPVFTVYLGRKSCPLSAPLAPKVVEAPDATAALYHITLPPWRASETARSLVTDAGVLPNPALEETRNDVPLDRKRWHFASRNVEYHRCDIRPHGGAQ